MKSEPPPKRRRPARFFPLFLFLVLAVVLFVGGGAALLYWLFSEYAGVRNLWVLICGAPVVLVGLILFTVVRLYMRYGRPLEQIFAAIEAVSDGDLSARVEGSRSDMFSELAGRLNRMFAELERADRQRRNLTADIAHELRNPLHVIQGNLEGLLDGVYQPTEEHLTNTLEETRLLSRLVNDLQTLSLAEAGQLPLHPSRFQMADLLSDLAASFTARAEEIGIALEIHVAGPGGEISADYDRLNQVLSNLISNALRHTPAGGHVAIEGSAGQAGVRILVRDTGAGIPPEDLPFIFDRFWRGDRARTRDAQGSSGLGLAIAKQLVQAHGGTITVRSVYGEGTEFLVDLPERETG